MLPCNTQGMTPDILKSALRNAQGTNVNNLRHHLPLSTLLLGIFLTACSTTPQTTATICSSPAATPWTLLGEVRWPHDLLFAGTNVGGLSAIDYDPGSGLYYLASDDRSAQDPARLYTARIRYDGAGLQEVNLQSVIPLRGPSQQLFTSSKAPEPGIATPDAEALRVLPGGKSLLWSSEGDFARGFGPQIIESATDGSWQQQWSLPPGHDLPHQPNQGPRNNFTLEGMAVSDDGKTLWVAMEAPLRQDGPMPSPGRAGGPVRITAYDMATQQPVRQLAYVPDALPAGLWIQRRALNGISEILADGPDHLLVLERSFAPPLRFGARIYRISTRPEAGSNTLNQPQLTSGNHQPLSKTLVLDLTDAGLRSVDNIEGMSWGPPLSDGRRVLLLVSDNNFNPAEITQFVALRQETGSCAAGL
jgi:hypothetical protein